MLWTAWVGLLPVTACHAAGRDTWAGAVTAELRLFARASCACQCAMHPTWIPKVCKALLSRQASCALLTNPATVLHSWPCQLSQHAAPSQYPQGMHLTHVSACNAPFSVSS